MTILQNYLKSKRVQKALTTKPGEEGFSLVELVVVIAVLAILSAVAIPAFTNVQANARSDLTWDSVASFSDPAAFRGFTLRALAAAGGGGNDRGADSCYAVEAISNPTGQNSGFTIFLRASDGVALKRCTDASKSGCKTAGGVLTWN